MRANLFLFISLVFAALVPCGAARAHPAAAERLALRWGLQKKSYYTETTATAAQNAAMWPQASTHTRRYRYFTVKGNSLQEDVSQFVASRHLVAWARYEARVP